MKYEVEVTIMVQVEAESSEKARAIVDDFAPLQSYLTEAEKSLLITGFGLATAYAVLEEA